jgi:hypothetical protein
VNRRFPTLPFTLRAVDEDRRGRLGITELASHDLVTPYPVLTEKAGELIAQVKFTALLTANGTQRLTPVPAPLATSQYAITEPALVALLAAPATVSTKKKKRSGKSKGGPGAAAAAGTAAKVGDGGGDDDDDDDAPAPAATAAAAAPA